MPFEIESLRARRTWAAAAHAALLGTLVATVSGCQAPQAAPPPANPAQELLLRYQQSQHLDAATRGAAAAGLRTRIASAPTLANRIELALLMTLPDAPPNERAAARELLPPCAGDPATDALVGLCVLTGRLLANDETLNRQLADAQGRLQAAEAQAGLLRQQIEALTTQSAAKQEAEARRIASLERQLVEQNRQIGSLRRQMRELQAIERSIEDRHEGGAPP